MIDKLGLPTMKELTEKLNEVIDFINAERDAKKELEDETEKACKLATHTGSLADLNKYLALRRRRL